MIWRITTSTCIKMISHAYPDIYLFFRMLYFKYRFDNSCLSSNALFLRQHKVILPNILWSTVQYYTVVQILVSNIGIGFAVSYNVFLADDLELLQCCYRKRMGSCTYYITQKLGIFDHPPPYITLYNISGNHPPMLYNNCNTHPPNPEIFSPFIFIIKPLKLFKWNFAIFIKNEYLKLIFINIVSWVIQ